MKKKLISGKETGSQSTAKNSANLGHLYQSLLRNIDGISFSLYFAKVQERQNAFLADIEAYHHGMERLHVN